MNYIMKIMMTMMMMTLYSKLHSQRGRISNLNPEERQVGHHGLSKHRSFLELVGRCYLFTSYLPKLSYLELSLIKINNRGDFVEQITSISLNRVWRWMQRSLKEED